MPTGTKFAAIAIVVLLGAAGLYFVFNSPSKNPKQSGATATSPSASSGNATTAIPSGARTTPETLTLTPNNTISPANPTGATTPTPSSGASGLALAPRNDQPTFTPGATGAANTGKGDAPGALTPGGLSSTGTGAQRPAANPLATNGAPMNGFAPPSTAVGANPSTTAGTTTTGTSPTTTASRSGPTPAGSGAGAFTPASNAGTTSAAPSSTSGGNTGSSEQTYIVKKDDTFTSIAKQFYGSTNEWKRIAGANPLVDPRTMKIGTKLRIPAKGATAVATAETASTGSGSTTGNASGTSSGNSSRTSVASSSTGGGTSHTVASGESLSEISRKYYGSSKYWQQIYASNKSQIGTDPGNLKVGQKLNIPAKTTVVGAGNVDR